MSDEPAGEAGAHLPLGIVEAGPTAWHHLDPLTRLVISVATVVTAMALSSVLALLVVGIIGVVLPALVAGVLGRLVRLTLLVALPLAVSAALVNLLFTPSGADAVLEIGPLRVTTEGIWTAARSVSRIVVIGAAVTLFFLTTRPAELVASLQSHGLPARIAFVVHGAATMIPRLAARAADVTAAQRARGMDSEGNLVRRFRGVLAVAGPTVRGAIEEAETRALALESRAFTHPGRHTLLRVPADSAAQRLTRWALTAAVAILVLVRLAGAAAAW